MKTLGTPIALLLLLATLSAHAQTQTGPASMTTTQTGTASCTTSSTGALQCAWSSTSSQTTLSLGPLAVNGIVASPSGSGTACTVAAPCSITQAQLNAQSATNKTIYCRAGIYSLVTQINLTAADNGETWTPYPPDGLNSCIFDLSGMTWTQVGGGNGYVSSFTGSISGTMLTIPGGKSDIHSNNVLKGAGILGGTQIVSGSGTTYTINKSQNVPSEPMTATQMGDGYAFFIYGGSNITFNGIQVANSPGGCFASGGGANQVNQYAAASTNANGNTFSNNICHDSANGGGPFNIGDGQNANGIYSTQYPGFLVYNTSTNTTVTHNYEYNSQAAPLLLSSGGAGPSHNGSVVSYNFIDNSNTAANGSVSDTGCLYSQDTDNAASTGVAFINNYVRDCAGRSYPAISPSIAPRCIYSDNGVNNITVRGNICTGTMAMCAFFGSGPNINEVYTGNICDMGASGAKAYVLVNQATHSPSGNVWNGNIIISNYTGTGLQAYVTGGGAVVAPQSIAANVYWNYAGGTVNYSGDATTPTDSAPQLVNPQFVTGNLNYQLQATSPAFNAPVSFTQISPTWGPPGFVVPAAGTAPSY